MICQEDISSIKAISAKYNIAKVLLFGSSLSDDIESGDIDLAVSGIDDSKFYQYYGELMLALSKPVDLVSLSDDSKFTRMIRSEGRVLYG